MHRNKENIDPTLDSLPVSVIRSKGFIMSLDELFFPFLHFRSY